MRKSTLVKKFDSRVNQCYLFAITRYIYPAVDTNAFLFIVADGTQLVSLSAFIDGY